MKNRSTPWAPRSEAETAAPLDEAHRLDASDQPTKPTAANARTGRSESSVLLVSGRVASCSAHDAASSAPATLIRLSPAPDVPGSAAKKTSAEKTTTPPARLAKTSPTKSSPSARSSARDGATTDATP